MSVQNAYWHGDWRRLFLSPFHHVDDWHLYFNLTSFLWKGINLERRMGGAWFLYVLSVFSLLTGLVYLGLEAGLTLLTDDHSYSVQWASQVLYTYARTHLFLYCTQRSVAQLHVNYIYTQSSMSCA